MTALPAPALAPVIPIDRPKRGRPSKADEAVLELAARRSEEQAAAVAVEPLLRRMELVAHEFGPTGWQTYAALAQWHRRHGARWADDDGAAA